MMASARLSGSCEAAQTGVRSYASAGLRDTPRCCACHYAHHTSSHQPSTFATELLPENAPVLNRRIILGAVGILPLAFSAPTHASRLQQDPRVKPLQLFWQQLVVGLQQQLSDDFAPNLVFYGPGEVLPSGTPSDPAAEYNKKAARACGPLTPAGFQQPYAICPGVPGAVAANDTARDCCRHFAFAVSRSRYALAAIDRQTSVVASPRLALAAPNTWQGILAHEMGHCIDFHTFPERYKLPAEAAPKSAAAAVALAAIDAREPDAELRADLMANALLVPLLGQKLCYDSRTRVQSLVPLSTDCMADTVDSRSSSSSSDPSRTLYMAHFPHPPVST